MAAREDAVEAGGLSEDLHLADIDSRALEVWRSTWGGRTHPGGLGGWDWPRLVQKIPRRAAVLPLAIAAALNYGSALGASRLLLRNPDPNVLWYYQRLGFDVAWEGGKPVYCVREI